MRIYPDFSLISDQFPWPSTSSPQLPSILVQVSRPMSCLHPPPPHLAPGSYCLQTRLLVTTSRILHYATTPYSHSAALIPVVCLSKQYIGGQGTSAYFLFASSAPILPIFCTSLRSLLQALRILLSHPYSSHSTRSPPLPVHLDVPGISPKVLRAYRHSSLTVLTDYSVDLIFRFCGLKSGVDHTSATYQWPGCLRTIYLHLLF
jgi:hypothetical protein